MFAMKEKSAIFGIFKRWRVMCESQTGASLKCLKTDNGGEYCSREFDVYCAEHGIRKIKTIPGTPEQNGVAERMNKTILERERSMRFDSGLPTYFWAAALDTAVYLINRSPSSALDGGIPEEVWTGKPVNLSFLKVFGCIAYSLIEKEKRNGMTRSSIYEPSLSPLSCLVYIRIFDYICPHSFWRQQNPPRLPHRC